MSGELKGWHVLAMMVAFFGITIAVNIMLTIYAIDTFSGEDVPKPYLRGLEYNRTLEARAAQTALGWTATIEAAREGSGAAVTAHVAGRDGAAKSALTVAAVLRRPADASLDRAITLTPSGSGNYQTIVEDLEPGAWDIVVQAKEGGVAFEAERRVVLK